MKKFAVMALVLIASSMSFAATMSCRVTPYVAGKAGLVPVQEILTTAKVSAYASDDAKSCVAVNIKGTAATFCAQESNFVGGYAAGLILPVQGEIIPTVGASIYGTAINGKGLVPVREYVPVHGSVITKLEKAKISIPDVLGADSEQIDAAIRGGLTAGVLTENEFVLAIIDSCQLTK